MKPPSRRRLVPLRFGDSKKSDAEKGLCTRWHRQELQHLLNALMQQKLNSELDYLELRKKVPKLSLLEIQKMIRCLKSRVGRHMYMHIRKQWREEQKTKVPIEIWAELTQRMAGEHEETISSAFSQMLVIAATEPCSLLHSDPPRFPETPDLLGNSLQTIQMRPVSHPGSETPSTPPPVIVLPGRTHKTPVRSCKKNASSHSTPTSTIITSVPQSSLISSAKANSVESQMSVTGKDSGKLSIPSTSKSISGPRPTRSQNQSVSKPTPPLSTSSAASTSSVLVPSHANQLPNHPERSGSQHDCQSKSEWTRLTVEFEKIYRFMSDINSKNCNLTLTAMESAVILDLLMALPEELPLLDCKELQHHLLCVQSNLKMPSDFPITAAAYPNSAEVNENQTSRDYQHGNGTNITPGRQTATNSSIEKVMEHTPTTKLPLKADYIKDKPPGPVHNDKVDWAAAGVCPLNPFMVPVVLLKQKSQETADQH